MPLIIVVGSILLSFVLTGLVRRYAVRTTLVDVPEERSSHSKVTPLGGGLAIVTVLLCVLLLTLWLWPSEWRILSTILVSLIVMAGLGWADDRRGLSVYTRLSVQAAVGVFVVLSVGSIDKLDVVGLQINLSGASVILSVLWFVWLTNLYNFMDGIDGLAAVQAVIAGGTMGYWFSEIGSQPLSLFGYTVMGASFGFLFWNWAPAKIFMGDVGSLALGATLAALSVVGMSHGRISWSAFLILLALFLADATATLLRRMLNKEKWWEAHRSHFYQRAVQCGWSHGHVAAVALVSGILLAGLATLEMLRYPPREVWIFLAILVLVTLALIIKRKESSLT